MDNLKKTLVILIWKSGLKGAQNFIHVYKMYLEIIYFFSSYCDVVFSLECECVVLLVECQYIFSISYRFRDKLNRNGQKGANFQNLNTFFSSYINAVFLFVAKCSPNYFFMSK